MSEQPMTPEQLLVAANEILGQVEVMRILASSFDPMVRRERLAAAIREVRNPNGHIENITRDEKLAGAIVAAGVDWHRKHDPQWRDNPWKDGIVMDLDEDEHIAVIVQAVNSVLAEAEIGL